MDNNQSKLILNNGKQGLKNIDSSNHTKDFESFFTLCI